MEASIVKRYLPWVVATALFMEQLDATIVNTAVPAMAESLKVTPLSLKAVAASYVLSLAVGIPVSGWIADRFGTKRVFAVAIAVFTIASVLCGLSQSAGQMVAARILQGAGAALMMPVGRLTIVRTFEKSELMTAMNFVIIPALIGPLLGPTVGGLIVHWLSWREIFFVNVPIGIAAQWLVHRHMPNYREEAERPFDWVGLALFGSGTALLSWLLEIFGEHQIEPVAGGALFAVAIALLLAYWRHAIREPYPLLDLALFRKRTFAVSVTGGFVTRLGVGGLPHLAMRALCFGVQFCPPKPGDRRPKLTPSRTACRSARFGIERAVGDAGCGDDRTDPAGAFAEGQVDQGDRAGFEDIAQHGAQDSEIRRDVIFLRARDTAASQARRVESGDRPAARVEHNEAGARAADADPCVRRTAGAWL